MRTVIGLLFTVNAINVARAAVREAERGLHPDTPADITVAGDDPAVRACLAQDDPAAARRSRGLSQEQLTGKLGVTPRYLAGVERAERNLSLGSVEALAKQLGVVPSLILDSQCESERI